MKSFLYRHLSFARDRDPLHEPLTLRYAALQPREAPSKEENIEKTADVADPLAELPTSLAAGMTVADVAASSSAAVPTNTIEEDALEALIKSFLLFFFLLKRNTKTCIVDGSMRTRP